MESPIQSTIYGFDASPPNDCIGGENSPYIWIDGKADSWQFFDLLLEKAGVVCTPGAGFGRCGEGYIRISAFNNYENVEEAMARIRKALS
jgi:LL-diaminopimelate aminotransferase